MKKIIFNVFALIVIVAFNSCENEPLEGFDLASPAGPTNSNNSANSSNLIGTWDLQSLDYTSNSTTVFNGTTTTGSQVSTGTVLDYQVTFTQTTFDTQGGYTIDSQITSNGTTISSTDTVSNVSGSGTYTTNGNEMTTSSALFDLSVNGVPNNSGQNTSQASPYTISPDGNTLTFASTIQEVINNSGVQTTVIVDAVSVFTRL